MQISVVIPTYNSEKTIATTLESVFAQTVRPDEILIVDDGSSDTTLQILEAFKPRISLFYQENHGVAHARNLLCKQAKGEFIAFLDHDDIWHPKYLETQYRLFMENPKAVAFFTENINFDGYGDYHWNINFHTTEYNEEVLNPVTFIKRYNNSIGTFYSMSFCCIPSAVLKFIGNEPFHRSVNGVDDCYLCNLFPLLGNVVFTPIPLVAYRVTDEAQSIDHLSNFAKVVEVFKLLEPRYKTCNNPKLISGFKMAFASKLRRHGKTLMGVGDVLSARQQFLNSLILAMNPVSIAKSIGLIILSFLPKPLQPTWPASHRK